MRKVYYIKLVYKKNPALGGNVLGIKKFTPPYCCIEIFTLGKTVI